MVIALAYHLRGPGLGHKWVKLVVGSLLCSERFFSRFSGFRLSSKINISKFQVDRMQDLPENHFRVSGASWVNINNNKINLSVSSTSSFVVGVSFSMISLNFFSIFLSSYPSYLQVSFLTIVLCFDLQRLHFLHFY